MIALTLLCLALPGSAEDIKDFYGTFKGSVADSSESATVNRDLSVTISKSDKGFSVKWMTTKLDSDGESSTKSYSIDFEPTRREQVYASAMKVNLFGARVPMDPLEGDPFVWARHDGDTLTVHSLLILDDGGYEMQSYIRVLRDFGLHLTFNRIRNGTPLKTIEADLVRQ